MNRERDGNGTGKGYACHSSGNALALLTTIRYVEYETAADLASAVEKLDNREFKGATVRCISDVSSHQLPNSLWN